MQDMVQMGKENATVTVSADGRKRYGNTLVAANTNGARGHPLTVRQGRGSGAGKWRRR